MIKQWGQRFKSQTSITKSYKEKKNKWISVQLNQDIPKLGLKGEIITVTSSYMRNTLHVDNKASYVLKGVEPRLPILTKEMKKKILSEQEMQEMPKTKASDEVKKDDQSKQFEMKDLLKQLKEMEIKIKPIKSN